MSTPPLNVHSIQMATSGSAEYSQWDLKTGDRTNHIKTGPQENRAFEIIKERPAGSTSPWVPTFAGQWRLPTRWSGEYVERKAAVGSTHGTLVVGDASNGGYKRQYDGSGRLNWLNLAFQFPPYSSNLKNRAEANALNNLKNQDINLGEFFGTFRETVNLVAGNAHKIRRSFLRFKHTRRGKNALKHLGGSLAKSCEKCKWYDTYLEMTYGWTPLMLDVFGALEHLRRESLKQGLVAHVRGTARDLDLRVYGHEDYTPGIAAYIMRSSIGSRTDFVTKCDLWYACRNPALAELSSLGLVNPVEILWELMRYSFVVDWFLPIGPWLSSLTGDVGWTFISGTCTERMEVEEGILEQSIVSPGWKGEVSFPYHAHGMRFRRGVYSYPPVPGFYLKNPLSAAHATNAIALLAAAFGR